MSHITTCSHCGTCYEEVSEEESAAADRLCLDCHNARRGQPRRLSCGCCTGIAVVSADGSPWYLDQCCCVQHQDVPRGRPARCCAFHRPGAVA